MTKRRCIRRGITVILVVASLLSVLTFIAKAAPISETITIPAGQTSFSINIRVNESTPYAGIEFALTINNESAVTFASFTNYPSGASGAPFLTKDGLHYFGYMKIPGSNAFPVGDNLAGTLNFTGYTGSQALTIAIVDVSVTRLNANNQSVTTKKESPAYVYSIQRGGSQPNSYNVTFNTAGGTRTGGGALVQTVPSGGAATAPTVERAGYTFNGWDRAFNNVTTDITVTAQWTLNITTPTFEVTFDPAGGTRISGGALKQTVSEGEAAIEPIVQHSGYNFNGWDKTFNSVNADMTVTAQWPRRTYTVTFDPAGGTRISGGALNQTVAEGEAAIEPIVQRSGYNFNGWDKTFNNVTSDTTVNARWTSIGGGSTVTAYTVKFDVAGGVRTGGGVLEQNVVSGQAATAPIVEREGYTFSGWDKTFNNVKANMTVTAQWAQVADLPDTGVPLSGHVHYFDDVTDILYSWAEPEVCALAEAGVVNGTSYRIYSPAANIKRGDFTLMLARAYGIDDVFTENFPDVPVGSYYYNAIGSAKIISIAKGYSATEFRPEAPMLRQEMMALIDRTLNELGKPLPRGSVSDIDAFSDRDLISDYALDCVAALVKSGIIQGSGGSINPLGYTTRAEMACALYRLMVLTGELTVQE